MSGRRLEGAGSPYARQVASPESTMRPSEPLDTLAETAGSMSTMPALAETQRPQGDFVSAAPTSQKLRSPSLPNRDRSASWDQAHAELLSSYLELERQHKESMDRVKAKRHSPEANRIAHASPDSEGKSPARIAGELFLDNAKATTASSAHKSPFRGATTSGNEFASPDPRGSDRNVPLSYSSAPLSASPVRLAPVPGGAADVASTNTYIPYTSALVAPSDISVTSVASTSSVVAGGGGGGLNKDLIIREQRLQIMSLKKHNTDLKEQLHNAQQALESCASEASRAIHSSPIRNRSRSGSLTSKEGGPSSHYYQRKMAASTSPPRSPHGGGGIDDATNFSTSASFVDPFGPNNEIYQTFMSYSEGNERTKEAGAMLMGQLSALARKVNSLTRLLSKERAEHDQLVKSIKTRHHEELAASSGGLDISTASFLKVVRASATQLALITNPRAQSPTLRSDAAHFDEEDVAQTIRKISDALEASMSSTSACRRRIDEYLVHHANYPQSKIPTSLEDKVTLLIRGHPEVTASSPSGNHITKGSDVSTSSLMFALGTIVDVLGGDAGDANGDAKALERLATDTASKSRAKLESLQREINTMSVAGQAYERTVNHALGALGVPAPYPGVIDFTPPPHSERQSSPIAFNARHLHAECEWLQRLVNRYEEEEDASTVIQGREGSAGGLVLPERLASVLRRSSAERKAYMGELKHLKSIISNDIAASLPASVRPTDTHSTHEVLAAVRVVLSDKTAYNSPQVPSRSALPPLDPTSIGNPNTSVVTGDSVMLGTYVDQIDKMLTNADRQWDDVLLQFGVAFPHTNTPSILSPAKGGPSERRSVVTHGDVNRSLSRLASRQATLADRLGEWLSKNPSPVSVLPHRGHSGGSSPLDAGADVPTPPPRQSPPRNDNDDYDQGIRATVDTAIYQLAQLIPKTTISGVVASNTSRASGRSTEVDPPTNDLLEMVGMVKDRLHVLHSELQHSFRQSDFHRSEKMRLEALISEKGPHVAKTLLQSLVAIRNACTDAGGPSGTTDEGGEEDDEIDGAVDYPINAHDSTNVSVSSYFEPLITDIETRTNILKTKVQRVGNYHRTDRIRLGNYAASHAVWMKRWHKTVQEVRSLGQLLGVPTDKIDTILKGKELSSPSRSRGAGASSSASHSEAVMESVVTNATTTAVVSVLKECGTRLLEATADARMQQYQAQQQQNISDRSITLHKPVARDLNDSMGGSTQPGVTADGTVLAVKVGELETEVRELHAKVARRDEERESFGSAMQLVLRKCSESAHHVRKALFALGPNEDEVDDMVEDILDRLATPAHSGDDDADRSEQELPAMAADECEDLLAEVLKKLCRWTRRLEERSSTHLDTQRKLIKYVSGVHTSLCRGAKNASEAGGDVDVVDTTAFDVDESMFRVLDGVLVMLSEEGGPRASGSTSADAAEPIMAGPEQDHRLLRVNGVVTKLNRTLAGLTKVAYLQVPEKGGEEESPKRTPYIDIDPEETALTTTELVRLIEQNLMCIEESLNKFSLGYKSAAIYIQKDVDGMQADLAAMLRRLSDLDIEGAFGLSRGDLRDVHDILADVSAQRGCYFFNFQGGSRGGCPWSLALKYLSDTYGPILDILAAKSDSQRWFKKIVNDTMNEAAALLQWSRDNDIPLPPEVLKGSNSSSSSGGGGSRGGELELLDEHLPAVLRFAGVMVQEAAELDSNAHDAKVRALEEEVQQEKHNSQEQVERMLHAISLLKDNIASLTVERDTLLSRAAAARIEGVGGASHPQRHQPAHQQSPPPQTVPQSIRTSTPRASSADRGYATRHASQGRSSHEERLQRASQPSPLKGVSNSMHRPSGHQQHNDPQEFIPSSSNRYPSVDRYVNSVLRDLDGNALHHHPGASRSKQHPSVSTSSSRRAISSFDDFNQPPSHIQGHLMGSSSPAPQNATRAPSSATTARAQSKDAQHHHVAHIIQSSEPRYIENPKYNPHEGGVHFISPPSELSVSESDDEGTPTTTMDDATGHAIDIILRAGGANLAHRKGATRPSTKTNKRAAVTPVKKVLPTVPPAQRNQPKTDGDGNVRVVNIRNSVVAVSQGKTTGYIAPNQNSAPSPTNGGRTPSQQRASTPLKRKWSI